MINPHTKGLSAKNGKPLHFFCHQKNPRAQKIRLENTFIQHLFHIQHLRSSRSLLGMKRRSVLRHIDNIPSRFHGEKRHKRTQQKHQKKRERTRNFLVKLERNNDASHTDSIARICLSVELEHINHFSIQDKVVFFGQEYRPVFGIG